MPVLSRFNGIVIRMYFQQSEHNPPHVHAFYGENVAAVDLQTGELLDGYLPSKALVMVKEWVGIYQKELLHIWETQEFKSLPPLE